MRKIKIASLPLLTAHFSLLTSHFSFELYFCKGENMKPRKNLFPLLTAHCSLLIALCSLLFACASGPKATYAELETKGTSMGLKTPDWVTTYVQYGISRVQADPAFRDKYVIIGEESGVNRQFVVAWADNFSAQQRIGAMLRTTIVSEYQAHVQGAAQSQGGANSSQAAGAASGEYNQQINSIINAIVNVSYSGAQRESDWWILRRRYDPDNKELYSDEYTAYVLYTFPKAELNRQVADALATSVSKDSELYDITIEMARIILQNGLADWISDYTTATTVSATASRPPASSSQAAMPAATASSSRLSELKNGTYTFWPRLQAKHNGLPADSYIVQIVVDGQYMIFTMTNVERGISGNRAAPGTWYINYNVLLTNLDRPSQTWRPVGHQDTSEGELMSFEGVTATRFSLECDWYGTTIFEEINLADAEYTP
jgi:hypothetical protein